MAARTPTTVSRPESNPPAQTQGDNAAIEAQAEEAAADGLAPDREVEAPEVVEKAIVVAPIVPKSEPRSEAKKETAVKSNLSAPDEMSGQSVPGNRAVTVKEPTTTQVAVVPKEKKAAPAAKKAPEMQTEGGYLRIGPGMKKPKVQRQPVLVYPSIARSQRVRGTVKVDVFVDEKGKVTQSKIAQSPSKLLDKEALRAAKRMRFQPYRVNGQAVKFVITVPFTFSPS